MDKDSEIIRGIKDEAFSKILKANKKLVKEIERLKSEKRPKIVCLCGSTNFKSAYAKANYEETLKGNIVLSVGCYMHYDNIPFTKGQKDMLDKLHFAKIDLADEILVLNVSGYIGYSTRNEIEFAKKLGKKVRYLEVVKDESN